MFQSQPLPDTSYTPLSLGQFKPHLIHQVVYYYTVLFYTILYYITQAVQGYSTLLYYLDFIITLRYITYITLHYIILCFHNLYQVGEDSVRTVQLHYFFQFPVPTPCPFGSNDRGVTIQNSLYVCLFASPQPFALSAPF